MAATIIIIIQDLYRANGLCNTLQNGERQYNYKTINYKKDQRVLLYRVCNLKSEVIQKVTIVRDELTETVIIQFIC